MNIDPQFVSLGPGEVQEFRAAPGARWQLTPCTGSLHPVADGVVRYVAPRLVCVSETVRITATGGGERGSAEISLSSAGFWITVLSVLWPVPALALMAAVFAVWPPPLPAVSAEIYPPVVTLAPGASQQFAAAIWNLRDQNVTWSASDGMITPAGLFTAPKQSAGRIIVTAVSKADSSAAATALVLPGESMALAPSSVQLGPSQTADLNAAGHRTEALEWFVTPPGVITMKDGHVSAPPRIPAPVRVVVTAKDSLDPLRQASAVVLVSADRTGPEEIPGGRDRSVIALVLVVGALGAFLGASRSFANFVGNRSFRPSWAVFYLFRPVFGSGLALLIWFGCRMGAVPGFTSSAGEPFGTAFLAGVTGLFADTVLGKLKEVISAMFPSREPHLDRMRPDATPNG